MTDNEDCNVVNYFSLTNESAHMVRRGEGEEEQPDAVGDLLLPSSSGSVGIRGVPVFNFTRYANCIPSTLSHIHAKHMARRLWVASFPPSLPHC